MKKRFAFYSLSLFFIFILTGCAGSYYKITDPVSKSVYYTDDIDKQYNGAIEFKDEATKAQVTLPQSEIIEITEDQYKANIHPK